ncbi:MAG: phosphotransferase family protein [Deltaproteobacteria bacterium]|nr:phosphotransferase family protein [Deltaproteobacteria bacterium]
MIQRKDVAQSAEITSDLGPIRPDEEMDWKNLESWLRQHLPGFDGPMKVAQFHGGHANLTYCLSFGAHDHVLRRPPKGTIAPGAHDMAREYRVLSGLSPSFDRAPMAIALCDDVAVIGAPFIVVERRYGVIVRDEIPETFRGQADVERRMSFALIDAMADLHAIIPEAVGLEGIGRPALFVERQLEGWHHRWALARQQSLPLFEEVYETLLASRPETRRHCIVHNDLKLDNCQFDPDDPDRVRSIFDWDMATLGDPLVELGTLLSYWRNPGDVFYRAPTIALDMQAFPTRSDLVSRYCQSGFDAEGIEWYEAFALWKQAAVLQQLYRRFEAGESKDSRFERLESFIPATLEGSRAILNGM